MYMHVCITRACIYMYAYLSSCIYTDVTVYFFDIILFYTLLLSLENVF